MKFITFCKTCQSKYELDTSKQVKIWNYEFCRRECAEAYYLKYRAGHKSSSLSDLMPQLKGEIEFCKKIREIEELSINKLQQQLRRYSN